MIMSKNKCTPHLSTQIKKQKEKGHRIDGPFSF